MPKQAAEQCWDTVWQVLPLAKAHKTPYFVKTKFQARSYDMLLTDGVTVWFKSSSVSVTDHDAKRFMPSMKFSDLAPLWSELLFEPEVKDRSLEILDGEAVIRCSRTVDFASILWVFELKPSTMDAEILRDQFILPFYEMALRFAYKFSSSGESGAAASSSSQTGLPSFIPPATTGDYKAFITSKECRQLLDLTYKDVTWQYAAAAEEHKQPQPSHLSSYARGDVYAYAADEPSQPQPSQSQGPGEVQSSQASRGSRKRRSDDGSYEETEEELRRRQELAQALEKERELKAKKKKKTFV